MRIDRITVYRVVIPYSGDVYRLSRGRTYTQFDSTIVTLTTDEGLVGWGESCPFGSSFVAAHALGVRAGIEEIAPHLLGRNPLEVDRINELMDDVLPRHPHVKSGLDMACWDILGKATRLPAYILLGGGTDKPMKVISSIPCDEPEAMVTHVDRLRRRGYRSHSIKVGSTPDVDIARIEAVMAARKHGESYLVDVNRGWTLDTALLVADGLKVGGFYYEQPCETLRECYAFKRRTGLPLMLDELVDTEETLLRVIADDGADAINLKVGRVGGLTKARRYRDICTAAGLALSVQDSAGSCITFAALVHLAQSISQRILRDVLDCRELKAFATADGAPEVTNGMVRATGAPGLGIVPRTDVLGEAFAVYE